MRYLREIGSKFSDICYSLHDAEKIKISSESARFTDKDCTREEDLTPPIAPTESMVDRHQMMIEAKSNQLRNLAERRDARTAGGHVSITHMHAHIARKKLLSRSI